MSRLADIDGNHITPDDILLFRRSLLARRFPGIQKMSIGDLVALLRAERKTTNGKPKTERTVCHQTISMPPPPKLGETLSRTTPSVPTNPSVAKGEGHRAASEVKEPAPMSASTSGQSDADDMDYITPEDVALFRRTLLARRFPGLQKMSEGDLIALIRAERKATGRKLMAEQKSHPKTTFAPPPSKREQPAPRVTPFVPANPFQAKDQAARANTERFIGVDTPYEGHRVDFNDGRTTDEGRRVAPFVPSCSSQAKDTLQIKYFLNSPVDTTVPLSQPSFQQSGAPSNGSSAR